jgi:hypothetical protein
MYTRQTFMPQVGFEPTITASERAKTVHDLDRPATVTGLMDYNYIKIRGYVCRGKDYV